MVLRSQAPPSRTIYWIYLCYSLSLVYLSLQNLPPYLFVKLLYVLPGQILAIAPAAHHPKKTPNECFYCGNISLQISCWKIHEKWKHMSYSISIMWKISLWWLTESMKHCIKLSSSLETVFQTSFVSSNGMFLCR